MEKALELWKNTKEELRNLLSHEVFNDSIAETNEIYKIENNVIYLIVPNNFAKFRITKYHLGRINEIAKRLSNGIYSFNVISADQISTTQQNSISTPDVAQKVTRRNIRPEYTFENFVTGEKNRFAFLMAMKAAESPYEVANPLYIFGDVGLGKTHLMMSIGNYALDNNNKLNVVYTTAQQFTEDYFNASSKRQNNGFESFYNYYRSADILLVDDIQFLSGKNQTQEEFFKLFEYLNENNKQIVLTSDRPANELENIMSRLKSRFSWGLLVDIKKPDFEHRKLITKKKLSFLIPNPNIVPEDVIEYIALHFDDNIRDLESAVRRVIYYCTAMNNDFSLQNTIEALEGILPKDKDDVSVSTSTQAEKIKNIVARHYKVDPKDLAGSSKKKEIAWARQVAMYLIKTQLSLQLTAIAKMFGGKDHTTVMHATKKIQNAINEDELVKQDIDYLCQLLDN